MKSLKKTLKSITTIIIIFIILATLTTIFNYFSILNYKTINIIKIIIPITSIFIGGYQAGKNSEKKGWLEGIKISLIISTIIIIITLILNKFKIEYLLYITILICSCTLGSMIGINKK